MTGKCSAAEVLIFCLGGREERGKWEGQKHPGFQRGL